MMGVKRALDLVIASSVIAATSPLWLPVVLLIKVTSPGPVLFRQTRVGLHGRPFTMLKFRSMKHGSDPTSLANSDDPRITTLGRWLRSIAVDELPQLINVLRGEMSIIGPRPALPEMVPYYKGEESRRQDVKPGLTGWAQVNGRNSLPYRDRLSLDLWYVRHWSLWLDLLILVKTIPAVFSRSDLYQNNPRPWERRSDSE